MPEWLTPQIILQAILVIFIIWKGLSLATKSLDINTINTRIDGAEKTINTRIDGVENTLNTKIDGVENTLNTRIDSVEKALVGNEHDTGGKPKTGGG